jgi:hypothetical protein
MEHEPQKDASFSANDIELAEASLQDALPQYPSRVNRDIDNLFYRLDRISYHRQLAHVALDADDLNTFYQRIDMADQLQSSYEYELKWFRRRERVRQVAQKFKGLLPGGSRNTEIDLPIGPFPL